MAFAGVLKDADIAAALDACKGKHSSLVHSSQLLKQNYKNIAKYIHNAT